MNENKNKSFFIKIIISVILLIFSFILSIFIGSKHLSFSQIIQAFKDKSSFPHTILFTLRLPRSLLAVISGALLASSGACFQRFFRNSLAEPGIIGISSAATLGAILSTLFINASTATGFCAILFRFVNPLNFFGFLGALAAGFVISFIASKSKGQNSITVLLCGTALGTFYATLSSIILLTQSDNLHGIYTWILGSFNGRGWSELGFITIPSILSLVIMYLCSSRLDLMICGEDSASLLGADVGKLRIWILISASLAVSASVCAGGTINFVGLIAPHLVRKVFGTKYLNGARLITLSMIFGAILVVLSDSLARILIAPSELPAGFLTSLLGAPFFISLLFKRPEDK